MLGDSGGYAYVTCEGRYMILSRLGSISQALNVLLEYIGVAFSTYSHHGTPRSGIAAYIVATITAAMISTTTAR